MPHLSLTRQKEGWVLPLMIGVNGRTTASLVAAGQSVPPPQLIRALIDTGTDISGVSASVLSQLRLGSVQQHTTQTLAGSVSIQLFEVSLTILQAAGVSPLCWSSTNCLSWLCPLLYPASTPSWAWTC
jgi:hypothetical protein